jgi:hypothetical protein
MTLSLINTLDPAERRMMLRGLLVLQLARMRWFRVRVRFGAS